VNAEQSKPTELPPEPLWRRVLGIVWFVLLIPFLIPFLLAQFLGSLLTNSFYPGTEPYSGPPQILRLAVGGFLVAIIVGFAISWLRHAQ